MAVDLFLKIDGIDGESKDSAHQNEIDLVSWAWEETNSGTFGTGGGGGSGKVTMKDVTFTMLTNKASPKLMEACATGKHIDTAVITCRKAGTTPQEFIKITLSNVLVSSFATRGQGGTGPGSDIPLNTFALDFAQISFDYQEQGDDGAVLGTIHGGYDLQQNKTA